MPACGLLPAQTRRATRDLEPSPERGSPRPTEALNLRVKRIKRAGRGFSCFEHDHLRVLLHAGGVT